MIKKYGLLYIAILFSSLAVLFLLSACGAKPSGTYKSDKPPDTYKSDVNPGTVSVTFTNDTLTVQNSSNYRYNYKYEIKNNGTEIIMTEIVHNKIWSNKFQYIKDIDCVIIGEDKFFR